MQYKLNHQLLNNVLESKQPCIFAVNSKLLHLYVIQIIFSAAMNLNSQNEQLVKIYPNQKEP